MQTILDPQAIVRAQEAIARDLYGLRGANQELRDALAKTTKDLEEAKAEVRSLKEKEAAREKEQAGPTDLEVKILKVEARRAGDLETELRKERSIYERKILRLEEERDAARKEVKDLQHRVGELGGDELGNELKVHHQREIQALERRLKDEAEARRRVVDAEQKTYEKLKNTQEMLEHTHAESRRLKEALNEAKTMGRERERVFEELRGEWEGRVLEAQEQAAQGRGQRWGGQAALEKLMRLDGVLPRGIIMKSLGGGGIDDEYD